MKVNDFEYKIGNHKIGRDTLIFNMDSATDCRSKELGLCEVCKAGKVCYALKAEIQYKQTLPFRRRQAEYWSSHSALIIALDIIDALQKHKKIKYIRFNESGDFRKQFDITKMKLVATTVAEKMHHSYGRDIRFYGYTARKDLSFGLVYDCPSLVLNGSGFYLDNKFTAVKELTEGKKHSKGDCRVCNYCKEFGKYDIEILYH